VKATQVPAVEEVDDLVREVIALVFVLFDRRDQITIPGREALEQLDEQAGDLDRVRRGAAIQVKELAGSAVSVADAPSPGAV
jgi:hypothetical protein